MNSDLFEHIDGLQSGLKRPGSPPEESSKMDVAANGQARAEQIPAEDAED